MKRLIIICLLISITTITMAQEIREKQIQDLHGKQIIGNTKRVFFQDLVPVRVFQEKALPFQQPSSLDWWAMQSVEDQSPKALQDLLVNRIYTLIKGLNHEGQLNSSNNTTISFVTWPAYALRDSGSAGSSVTKSRLSRRPSIQKCFAFSLRVSEGAFTPEPAEGLGEGGSISALTWLTFLYHIKKMNENEVREIIRNILQVPHDASALLQEVIELAKEEEIIKLETVFDEAQVSFDEITESDDFITRKSKKHRKKKHRSGISKVFKSIASTCVKIGQVAAIAGPEKQMAANAVGLLFNMASKVTGKKKHKKSDHNEEHYQEDQYQEEKHEEGVIAQPETPLMGTMSKEEFATNIIMLSRVLNSLIVSQQNIIDNQDNKKVDGQPIEQTKSFGCTYGFEYIPGLMNEMKIQSIRIINGIADEIQIRLSEKLNHVEMSIKDEKKKPNVICKHCN